MLSNFSACGKPEQTPPQEVSFAKVIVIAGQSNASGFTWNSSLKDNVSSNVYDKYEAGFDDMKIYYNVDTVEPNGYTWQTQGENTSNGDFTKVKLGQGHNTGRFGIEIGIADYFETNNIKEKVYLIKCAWGSASLFYDFASPSISSTNVYWDKFIEVVYAGLHKLSSYEKNYEISAFCWIQGEKDSSTTTASNNYGTNLQKMVGDFRNEFKSYESQNGIKFIDAGLGANEHWTNLDIVNQHKQWFANQDPTVNFYIDTLDLEYHKEPVESPDVYHFDSLSMIELGHRFGKAIAKIL